MQEEISRSPRVPRGCEPQCHWASCATTGFTVGGLTGFLGVGGGFLIVPALLIFGRLPLKLAIGTSLVVITVNCIGGLAGHVPQAPLDWQITAMFLALALAEMFAGTTAPARKSLNWFGYLRPESEDLAEGITASCLSISPTIDSFIEAPGVVGCVGQAAAHAPPRHALPPRPPVNQVTDRIIAKTAASA